MGWDVEFEARPLKLKLTRHPSSVKRMGYLMLPDPLYRKFTRKLVRRLQRENAALKRMTVDPRGAALLVAEREQAQRQFEELRSAILGTSIDWDAVALNCRDPHCHGMSCRHVDLVLGLVR